ncbi:MAG TPA: hypothetical protein VN496_01370 [Burkholderiales bacterium]|nr:hypothetical protein [Burkholderiales bacterium]
MTSIFGMRNSGRRLGTMLCRFVLGVMVFAQVANASQSCVAPEMSPIMAFSQDKQDDHCHKGVNPNSCLQQANASDQSLDHAQTPVFATSSVAILVLPWATDCAVPGAVLTAASSPTTDPPPLIRFCSLQL